MADGLTGSTLFGDDLIFSQVSPLQSLYHSRKSSWSWRAPHKTLTLSSSASMSKKTLRKQTRTTGMWVYLAIACNSLGLSASMGIMHATCACVWNGSSLGAQSTWFCRRDFVGKIYYKISHIGSVSYTLTSNKTSECFCTYCITYWNNLIVLGYKVS